ncbi:MAG: AlpA family phage regulatory protein [Pseudomonadota bacterium]|nr:AlpA family phage regulatory protein [Pseudomonadota bacterium]
MGRPADTGRFLRLNDVIATIGLSKSQIYRMIQAEQFPKPIPLTARAVGWWESTVTDWLNSRRGEA